MTILRYAKTTGSVRAFSIHLATQLRTSWILRGRLLQEVDALEKGLVMFRHGGEVRGGTEYSIVEKHERRGEADATLRRDAFEASRSSAP